VTTSSESSVVPKTVSPSFDEPPVVETALGIQFDELAGFKTAHFGLFYREIRDRYRSVEDQPRLEPIAELFPQVPRVPAFRFQTRASAERVWYRDKLDGSFLLQLQADRLGFNWKKADNSDSRYPSYSVNVLKFLDEHERFCTFCRHEDLGDVRPNLCEVIYVNHILPIQGEDAISLFPKVFTGIEWKHADDSLLKLPKPELASLNRVYVIGENKGRLYAEASIAYDQKKRREFILLKMTARVLADDSESVAQTLQTAHDWAVNGFVSVTNASFRKERWRQTP